MWMNYGCSMMMHDRAGAWKAQSRRDAGADECTARMCGIYHIGPKSVLDGALEGFGGGT
jgi:hypothetical protein